MTALGAIDCGTNTTRLLVVDGDRVLERRTTTTRLGHLVDATGMIDRDAIERTLCAIREYADVLTLHNVHRFRITATSASRDASNAEVFCDGVREILGVDAEVLSGESEGALAYAGATASLPVSDGHVLVVDIGGGSTELILGLGARVLAVESHQIGAVRLTERYLGTESTYDPRAIELARMASAELFAASDVLSRARHVGVRVVAVAGTATTIAAVVSGTADEYVPEVTHGHFVSREDVCRFAFDMATKTHAERCAMGARVAKRADLLAAGSIILDEVIAAAGASGYVASEHDILDGLISSLHQV